MTRNLKVEGARMSIRSQLQNSPCLAQLPSYHVARVRVQLLDSAARRIEDCVRWPGRNYSRRLVKPMAICGLGGAAMPLYSEFLTTAACYGATYLPPMSHYQSYKCPYIRAPISCWFLFGAAGALVGVSGAPERTATDQAARLDASASAASECDPGPDRGLFRNRTQAVVERIAELSSKVCRYGVLGLCQDALAAEGRRRTQKGQQGLADACHVGATLLLIGMEPVRLALQLVSLGLELSLAVPCAALGLLMGMGIFVSSIHADPWPQPRNAMAFT